MALSHTDTSISNLKINKFSTQADFEAAVAQGLIGNDEISMIDENIQSDWTQSDSNEPDYIKNKPTIPDAVSGTNDGTNWTSLTIGSTTKAIPAGGSSLPSQTGNSGKFLTTDGSDASWANLPSDVFWCNFTLTENNGNTTVTCDKTVSEIVTAYNSGKSVIGKVGYTAIPLSMVEEDSGIYYIAFVFMSGASYTVIQGINSTNPDDWTFGYVELGISDLTDVSISSAANNDVLKYDSTAGKWVNGQVSGGSSTLSGLTDTTISSPADGQMLKYDNASSKWINANVPTEIPSQTGNSGKFLTTNGSAVSWGNIPTEIPTQTGNSGKFLTTNGSAVSWANAPTELPSIGGNASKILAVNSGATGVEWVTPSGGGGLTDYDFTHTQILGTPNSVTFAAGERCSVFAYVNIDTSMSIECENNSDNYIWISNSGVSDVDITISDITQNSISVSNVYMPEDGITVPAGKVCEIGVIVNSSGAFITCRNDIVLSSSI